MFMVKMINIVKRVFKIKGFKVGKIKIFDMIKMKIFVDWNLVFEIKMVVYVNFRFMSEIV